MNIGEGRFKVGDRDRVVFRLGERENQTCPHCGANTYNSEFEDRLVALTGKILKVAGTGEEIAETLFLFCYKCHGEAEPPYPDYGLLDTHTYSNGVHSTGFLAYESELSPAPLESKNEMYRYLYGGRYGDKNGIGISCLPDNEVSNAGQLP